MRGFVTGEVLPSTRTKRPSSPWLGDFLPAPDSGGASNTPIPSPQCLEQAGRGGCQGDSLAVRLGFTSPGQPPLSSSAPWSAVGSPRTRGSCRSEGMAIGRVPIGVGIVCVASRFLAERRVWIPPFGLSRPGLRAGATQSLRRIRRPGLPRSPDEGLAAGGVGVGADVNTGA